MSSSASPELRALAELETIVRHAAEELASWRRRALKAETDRSSLGVDGTAVAARERIVQLEKHNTELRARLEGARERVQQLLNRLRFLEEQAALEEEHR